VIQFGVNRFAIVMTIYQRNGRFRAALPTSTIGRAGVQEGWSRRGCRIGSWALASLKEAHKPGQSKLVPMFARERTRVLRGSFAFLPHL